MRIPLSRPDITEAEIQAVAQTLREPQLSLGPRLPEFEATFTELTGVAHALAVSSGTAGLHLAFRALGIGPGDEVIVPSFTFIAAANAIRYELATPVFVDIDPDSLNLSPAAVERAITPRTRAILAVHTFGRPADMQALAAIARERRLALVEDACEAVGAAIDERPVGSFGDVAVFAFYPNKQITTGEGGMVVTPSAELADRMRALRNQGRDEQDEMNSWFQHTELGFNYRLSEIACTLGIGQMARLEEILSRRQEVAMLYQERLASVPQLLLPTAAAVGTRISWFVYVVRLNDAFTAEHRDAVVAGLSEQGIGCGRYFAPIHMQPAYAQWRHAAVLPVTELVACRTLALPFYNRVHTETVDEVCQALRLAIGRIQ